MSIPQMIPVAPTPVLRDEYGQIRQPGVVRNSAGAIVSGPGSPSYVNPGTPAPGAASAFPAPAPSYTPIPKGLEKPEAITYSSPAGLSLKNILGTGLLSNTQLDKRAMDAMRTEALRTGPSAWRGLMDQQMGLKYAGMGDQLAQQQAGQLAGARSALAMRGGLRGGSAERLAAQGMQQGLLERQRLARGRAEEGMGYSIQDELNRQQQLGASANMDLQAANFAAQQNQFDIANAFAERARKSEFDLRKYTEDMSAWAARQTAGAIRNS